MSPSILEAVHERSVAKKPKRPRTRTDVKSPTLRKSTQAAENTIKILSRGLPIISPFWRIMVTVRILVGKSRR